jgi:hypothetical protein
VFITINGQRRGNDRLTIHTADRLGRANHAHIAKQPQKVDNAVGCRRSSPVDVGRLGCTDGCTATGKGAHSIWASSFWD